MEKQILLLYRCLKSHPRLLRCALILLLVAVMPVAYAQTTVTGKVKDETGNGLPGVNIIVKGTSNGTVSDAQGDYTIALDQPDATLVFSFIGYANQEVAVGGRSTVEVALTPSAVGLSEVVVTGYGTQRKSDVTGAIVQLGDQAMRDVAVSNPTQALQGRVAGVDVVSTSPRPGGGATIRIRGNRSVTPDANDPLIVVDGIPFNGSINDLNINDIVSMDILKDASATAIYGSRGSNGVILVTTRSGKKGKPTLFYDGYYGVNAAVGKYSLYNGLQFNDFRNAAIAAGAAYAPTTDEIANMAAGKETNWQEEMYQEGYITNHSIGATGGTDDTQYSISGGYFKQTTIMPGQAATRYSLSTKIDQKIGERIRVGLSSQNTLNITDGENANPMFQLLTLSPLYNAYNPDGSIYNLPATGSIDATTRNPLLLNKKDSWQQQRKRLRTFNSLYGEVKIVEGLKYRINIGLDYFTDNYGHYYGSETPFQNGAANTAQVQNTNSGSYTIENLLMYEKSFAEKHKISLTGLYSVQSVETYGSTINAQDLPADYTLYYNLGLANTTTVPNGTYTKFGLVSWMARANYSFSERFLATVTIRRDGSSRLAPGYQYFNYPAAALAWNIHKEGFMSGLNVVSNLKLRVGAGQTSNQAVAPYSTQGALGRVPYNFGNAGLFGYGVTSLPNPALSWEFTTTYNIGLDFGLWQNRLTGSLEFYKSFTEDILQPRNLPPTSGVTQVTQNIGKSENSGVELTLSGIIMESKTQGGFSWSADVNWFMNREKITELGSGVLVDATNGWYVGHPVNSIYDYTKIGIWQSADATEATAQGGFIPGNIRVKDINGDNLINTNDRSVIGSTQPDWQGGLTNRFTYKGFGLDIVIFARVGGMLVSSFYQAQQGNPYNTLEGRRNGPLVNYWTPTNPSNEYPRPGQAQQPIFGSTLGYFDATFMKIRSINLRYNLPSSILGKTGLSSVQFYLQAQNPFEAFFSPYVDAGGVDPEPTGFANFGSNTPGWGNRQIVGANTPPVKQFILGVNLKY